MMQPTKFAAALALIVLAPAAYSQVDYTTTDISGNTWQYNYTVTNSFLSSSVGEFTVLFPVGQYSNLTVQSSPGAWSSIVAQPDPNLPAAGYFDAASLNSGLAPGKSIAGFSTQFTWSGHGTPGAQTFQIVNPSTFATLFTGTTTLTGIRAPEIDPASSIAAVTLLLASLAVLRGRKSTR